MNKATNPAGVAPPVGLYSHAVEVPANSRWLYISGQVGIAPDGRLMQGVEAQTEQACRNIIAILEANGMGLADIVKVTSYLVNLDDLAGFRAARTRAFGQAKPASTLAVIKSLVGPQYLVEIEAVAAKAVPAARAARPAASKSPAKKLPTAKRKASPAKKKARRR